MIGPPTDPTEVRVAASLATAPFAWLLCLGVGVGLLALGRRSSFLRVCGLVLLLTAPAAGLLTRAVWGHYPTVDKAGSLHFFGLGAHSHSFDVAAPATQLIGMSMGHLWVTQAFALLVAPFAAMNAQALLNVTLGWWLAAKLGEAAGADKRWAWIAGFPAGMGLHLFRDINWYTIEKSGGWALTLYVYTLVRAAQTGGWWIGASGVAYFWAFYYNSYWGVLGALVGAMALAAGNRDARWAVGASVLGGLPFVLLQLPALHNAQLPAPEAFATRATLDVLTVWPPAWNRLDLWAALDWIVSGAAVFAVGLALRRAMYRGDNAANGNAADARLDLKIAAAMAVPIGLSLGPPTPLWTAFVHLPGMWRFAKPETFLHLAVLGSTVLAGRYLSRTRWPVLPVFLVQVGLWVWLVRGHPAFPGFSAPPP